MNNAAASDANGQKHKAPPSAVASREGWEEPLEGKVEHERGHGGKLCVWGGSTIIPWIFL